MFLLVSLCSCAGLPQKEGRDLVDIKPLDPSIVVDIRYATTNNFTGQRLYDSDRCLLYGATALKLCAVQNDLRKIGLGLKVFDGYRPASAQRHMWKLVHDENYVTDPAKGSFHSIGVAVDVTLVDRYGRELPMGSGYDEFSERAHLDFTKLPREILNNRKILFHAMKKHGFLYTRTEWWHYIDKDWKLYKIEELKKAGLR